jgi:putative hydrolase of the HAD superfamily
MNPIHAVGFDLDYTLMDQGAFLATFLDGVRDDLGARLGLGPLAVSRAFMGLFQRLGPSHPRLFDQALRYLGAWDAHLVRDLVERYHAHRPPLHPYPGARAALEALRGQGRRLFLVTDGFAPSQRHKLRATGLEDLFDTAVYTGDLDRGLAKPSPAPFRLALRPLGLEGQACAFVGDNPRADVPGARSLGMITLGVATGPYARLAPPPRWGWMGREPWGRRPRILPAGNPTPGPAFDLGLCNLLELGKLPCP